MEPEVRDYEVFLSFRGPDTGQGFADVLYDYMTNSAGIRVFRDDDELAVGDKIETILQAIKNSQLCVPIFSETFASSKWCLREVRRMSKLGKEVAPIFYKVTPDDVKLKTDAYRGFMKEQQEKYGKEKVEKWEDALKTAAQFKGLEVLNTRYTEFCKEFVNQILMKLGPRKKFETDHVNGIDDQLESVEKLLDMESTDVKYVGICGMGGIGKTTLAKVIYDKYFVSFDSYSFIKDVRESHDRHGLGHLEKQLQENLNPRSKGRSDFFNELKGSFCRKKVLIVLDDIDKPEQVEALGGKSCWFGPGSRIIVTTRDTDVLTRCKTLNENEICNFEMEMLQKDHALRLFSRRAFRKDSPPADFKMLSEDTVSTCGGLPLALVVIGSLLKDKGKEVWEDVVAESRKIPIQEIKQRLKISYDKLDKRRQQIFLDIACLDVCTDKSKACYMWPAPHFALAVLQSLSLIKITCDNRIWMHDQLRDLGKDIVSNESVHARMRSRLWEHEEALKVLMIDKSKENVQVICLNKPCSIILTHKELASFDSLRFLQLDEAEFRGAFDQVLPELTWLSWKACSRFEASSFTASKLVFLDLSGSSMTENWRGWTFLQGAKNLRHLDLSRCLKLNGAPHFPEDMILERLILKGCERLVSINTSIGNLKCLIHLDLRDCQSLCRLPTEISSLVKLNTLSVYGCPLIKKFPCSSTGQLKSLVELDMSYSGITELPASVGEFLQLKRLNLAFSEVAELPHSIGALKSLVSFDLRGTKFSKLPSSIGGLVKLELLWLQDSKKLRMLPDSIGELTSLVQLDLAGTTISELPSSVGRLGKLEELELYGCSSVQALPHSVGELKSLILLGLSGTAIAELPEPNGGLEKLEGIIMEGPNSLIALPHKIGRLSSLRALRIRGSHISRLPSSISQLPLLEQLCLTNCHQLRELPELPTSLTSFHVSSESLQIMEVPLLSKLVNLRYLTLPIITSLPTDFNSALSQLELLNLDCRNLKYPSQLPASLMHLSLKHVNSETNLPCLSNLKQLGYLDFHKWSENDGFESLRLEDLNSLSRITVRECSENLIHGVCRLKNLKSLEIQGCELIGHLLDLSGLRNLADLRVWGCQRLIEITGLENLNCLQDLSVYDCNSLKGLESMTELTCLTVIDCGALTRIHSLGNLKCLEGLTIKGCNSLKGLENMSELTELRNLYVVDCRALTRIHGLGNLKCLEWLTIEGCNALKGLENMSELTKLEYLNVVDCRALTRIHDLGDLKCLKWLIIKGCNSLKGLGNISELTELKHIDVDCDALTSCQGVDSSTLERFCCGTIEVRTLNL